MDRTANGSTAWATGRLAGWASGWKAWVIAPVLALALLAQPGCSDMNKAQKGAVVGTLAGAAIGGLFGGNHLLNAGIGAGIGLALGYIIGNEWDKSDQAKLNRSLESGKTGTPARWSNPDTGKQYTATPMPAYQQDGRTCRNVQIETVDENGKKEMVTAKAWRDQNGQWQLAQ